MSSNKPGLPSISPQLFSQIVFGGFLIGIMIMAQFPWAMSICLGILGGFIFGWFTSSSKESAKPEAVASSEGIDAALKYWLFFLLGFVFVGYSPAVSIVLGAVAAIGGGWITAWWASKEDARTQLPVPTVNEVTEEKPRDRITRQRSRKSSQRYRRAAGSFNFRFWEK